jgi:hypothetical protein
VGKRTGRKGGYTIVTKLNKLSALTVRNLEKPGHCGDGGGLWLQISDSGTKSWVFRYDLDGKRHEMGLGAVHTVELALARTKARCAACCCWTAWIR